MARLRASSTCSANRWWYLAVFVSAPDSFLWCSYGSCLGGPRYIFLINYSLLPMLPCNIAQFNWDGKQIGVAHVGVWRPRYWRLLSGKAACKQAWCDSLPVEDYRKCGLEKDPGISQASVSCCLWAWERSMASSITKCAECGRELETIISCLHDTWCVELASHWILMVFVDSVLPALPEAAALLALLAISYENNGEWHYAKLRHCCQTSCHHLHNNKDIRRSIVLTLHRVLHSIKRLEAISIRTEISHQHRLLERQGTEDRLITKL